MKYLMLVMPLLLMGCDYIPCPNPQEAEQAAKSFQHCVQMQGQAADCGRHAVGAFCLPRPAKQ